MIHKSANHNHDKEQRPSQGAVTPKPMKYPMACDCCGAIFEQQKLSDFQIQTLGAIRCIAPGDCEPAEYEIRCPDCGARESFQPATTCAECGEYPCCCLDAMQ